MLVLYLMDHRCQLMRAHPLRGVFSSQKIDDIQSLGMSLVFLIYFQFTSCSFAERASSQLSTAVG